MICGPHSIGEIVYDTHPISECTSSARRISGELLLSGKGREEGSSRPFLLSSWTVDDNRPRSMLGLVEWRFLGGIDSTTAHRIPIPVQ